MRNTVIVSMLLSCAAPLVAQVTQHTGQSAAQQRSPARPTSAAVAPAGANVPADAVVITLDGVCEASRNSVKKTPAACKTVITRAQLDALVDEIMPGASEASRRQFATNYPRLLAGSAEAERKHLGKDPAVAKSLQIKMNFLRMQVMTDALYKNFDQLASAIPPSEIQEYYKTHAADYESANLERVAIPKNARALSGVPLPQEQVKAEAETMRARAVAGEDCTHLQTVVYKELNLNPAGIPTTKLDNLRRSGLSAMQLRMFDLRPGEVSDLQETIDSIYFLKMVSKQTAPLESVEAEIRTALRQERLQKQLDGAASQVKGEFDLSYLGVATAPELFPAPGAKQMAGPITRQDDPRTRTMKRRRVPVPSAPATGTGATAPQASTPGN